MLNSQLQPQKNNQKIHKVKENLSVQKELHQDQFPNNQTDNEILKCQNNQDKIQELNQDHNLKQNNKSLQQHSSKLNDDIRRLKTENKKAFSERMRLEAQKNKLENLLTNNLIRRKDELVQALQEISVEDRHQQLENCVSDLKSLEERLDVTKNNMKGLDKNLQEVVKKRKKYQAELEASRLREREIQDKIEEDAKELERMASKQTVLQQKIQERIRNPNQAALTYPAAISIFSTVFLIKPNEFDNY